MNWKFKLIFLFSSILVVLLFIPVVQAGCGCDCVHRWVSLPRWDDCHGDWAIWSIDPGARWKNCIINPSTGYQGQEVVGESCSYGNSVCHTGYCPSVGGSDGDPCLIYYPYWSGISCYCSFEVDSIDAHGVWDESEGKCIKCDDPTNYKKENRILADTTDIPDIPVAGDSQCESACGANLACDEKTAGQSCGTEKVCDSVCNCISLCTDTDNGNYPLIAGTCTDATSHQDSCSGGTLTEYYCLGGSCASTPKNCNDYDCTTGLSSSCFGVGTSTLTRSGDDYTCYDTNPDLCGTIAPDIVCPSYTYICGPSRSCDIQSCASTNYKCYRSNAGSWKWDTSAEATETACSDGYDNDCDGNIDCHDSDCPCPLCANHVIPTCVSNVCQCSDCTSNLQCEDGWCCPAEVGGSGSSCVDKGVYTLDPKYLCDPPNWSTTEKKPATFLEIIWNFLTNLFKR